MDVAYLGRSVSGPYGAPHVLWTQKCPVNSQDLITQTDVGTSAVCMFLTEQCLEPLKHKHSHPC